MPRLPLNIRSCDSTSGVAGSTGLSARPSSSPIFLHSKCYAVTHMLYQPVAFLWYSVTKHRRCCSNRTLLPIPALTHTAHPFYWQGTNSSSGRGFLCENISIMSSSKPNSQRGSPSLGCRWTTLHRDCRQGVDLHLTGLDTSSVAIFPQHCSS